METIKRYIRETNLVSKFVFFAFAACLIGFLLLMIMTHHNIINMNETDLKQQTDLVQMSNSVKELEAQMLLQDKILVQLLLLHQGDEFVDKLSKDDVNMLTAWLIKIQLSTRKNNPPMKP